MIAARRGPQRRDEGQAAIELALLLPVLAVLLLALLQLALVARDVVLVTHASREAARVAAVDSDLGAAREAALGSGGLDPDRMQVRSWGRSGPGSRVTVEVSYRIPTNVPLIGGLLGDHPVSSRVTMRVEDPR